jgi:hypothetical protein
MKSFEQILGLSSPELIAEFHGDCQDIFRTPAGRRVMTRLVHARHPMGFPQGDTVEQTMVANGQREVVATLFRFSQPTITTQ